MLFALVFPVDLATVSSVFEMLANGASVISAIAAILGLWLTWKYQTKKKHASRPLPPKPCKKCVDNKR